MASSSRSPTDQTARGQTIDLDKVDNSFFNVYLCHICKEIDSFERAKVCSGCKLISYCSSEHQKLHWPRHKAFCKAVQSLCRQWGVDSVFFVPEYIRRSCPLLPEGRTPRQDFSNRKSIARHFLELSLGRELSYLEKQARNFPKICETCFSPTVVKTLVCKQCFGVGYCSEEHKKQDAHELVCSKYREDLLASLFFWNGQFHDLLNDGVKADRGRAINLDLDMKTFIATYIDPKLNFEKEAMVSLMYTWVLSLAHAVRRLPDFKLKKNLRVHIVGAAERECAFRKYWETILHIFPKLQNFQFILIGPDANGPPSDQMEYVFLCDHCENTKKCMTIGYYEGFYHDYCRSTYYLKPDVICCFNSGLHEILPPRLGGDTWKDTLPMLIQLDDVPVILTAWCRSEAERDLKRLLANTGGKKVKVLMECEKNPFLCLRPFRSWENTYDAVFYDNSYMSILTVPRK